MVLDLLRMINIWNSSYIKDTVFWVLFVELPLSAKAIETKEGNFFFKKLIKDNLKIIVVFEFFINYWSFSMLTEICFVPIFTVITLCSVIASQEKKYSQANKLLNWILGVGGIVVLINALYNTIVNPFDFFNFDTLRSFVLPVFLLVLNIPIIYGLSLYSGYEQLFIRIKSGASHKLKMKLLLLRFAGFNLSKIKALRENLHKTLFISLSPDDLKHNLQLLEQKLSLQIGDVYMKRPNFYLVVYVLIFIISLVGLVLTNSEVPIKDLLTLNFVIIVPRLKEILTYIFATAVVFSFGSVIYFWGFRKKKYEDISQVKKFVLHDFLFIVEMQKKVIEEYPSFNDPILLYTKYVIYANQISQVCQKLLGAYENLLSRCEKDRIDSMYTYTVSLLSDLSDKGGNFTECPVEEFINRYNQKVNDSAQDKDTNAFQSILKRDLEEYIEKVNETFEDFSYYY